MDESQMLHIPKKWDIGETTRQEINLDKTTAHEACKDMRKRDILQFTESESQVL